MQRPFGAVEFASKRGKEERPCCAVWQSEGSCFAYSVHRPVFKGIAGNIVVVGMCFLVQNLSADVMPLLHDLLE